VPEGTTKPASEHKAIAAAPDEDGWAPAASFGHECWAQVHLWVPMAAVNVGSGTQEGVLVQLEEVLHDHEHSDGALHGVPDDGVWLADDVYDLLLYEGDVRVDVGSA